MAKANGVSSANGTQSFEYDWWSDASRAELYAQFRPKYQTTVIPWLIEYYTQRHQTSASAKIPFAIDVGCGSGQLTSELAAHFDRVVGIDISRQQLDVAKKYNDFPNVEYRIGSASDLSRDFQNDKADVVTVGMAFQYLDADVLYAEVEKVLKPGGVLGIFGYLPVGINQPGLQDLLAKFMEEQVDHPTMTTVKNFYEDQPMPFDGHKIIHTVIGYPCNRKVVEAFFLSTPQILKNGVESVKQLVKKIPEKPKWPMSLRVSIFGTIVQINA